MCRRTPYARASAAVSRIRSCDTENGEHGAAATRSIENRAGSWYASITRRVSARIASSRSTSASGGSPPADSPTLIAPRHAWKRRPSVCAASIVSSSRPPFGWRYRWSLAVVQPDSMSSAIATCADTLSISGVSRAQTG